MELNLDIRTWGLKEYIVGFEEDGSLITEKLNIFQRIIRWFGYYAETHLLSVLSLAKNKIFKENLAFDDGTALKIAQLFKKYVDKNSTESIRYVVGSVELGAVQIDNASFKCRIYFTDDQWVLTIDDDNEQAVSIYFGHSEHQNTLLVRDILDSSLHDQPQQDSGSPLVKAISLALESILQHSSQLEKFCFAGETLPALLGADWEKDADQKCWFLPKQAVNIPQTLQPVSFDFILKTAV